MVVFCCSAVEQPDVVFSVEQIRSGRAEPCSPQKSEACDPECERVTISSQTEDAASNRCSAAPELLQVAPKTGDTDVPSKGETNLRGSVPFFIACVDICWFDFTVF